jgi:6,7-dimethyl-8-ribityllumazine synthase
MHDVTIIEGRPVLTEAASIAVVCARFNHFIVDQLEAGCLDALNRHATAKASVTVVRVPGAFELPVAVRKLAQSGKYDAVIALGAVIRGSTAHFEHVAGGAERGLGGVAADTGVPVIFGVLTVDTIEQAIERAGTKAGNKGAEAATVALEMISLMRQL